MDLTTSYPFADRALAQRLEGAEAAANARFVEARARVAPDVGACWITVAGAYAMFDGPDSPLTQTFGLGLFDGVGDAELDRIEVFFLERQAPVFHEVSPIADGGIVELLNARGYEPIEFTSVMYRPVAAEGASTFKSATTVRVRLADETEHQEWTDLAARGWSDFPELAAFMRDIGKVTAARADTLLFIADDAGEPIAAAALSLHEDVALLAGASTVPAARGRGAQGALLDARLQAARNHRCALAMMGALPGSASQRNAERNGFRIAYTRIKWRLAR
jgi:GNAT superfamily N-acetyltransferase